MKVRTYKTLTSNVYKVELRTEATEVEQNLIDLFGEPEVNVGGSFTGPPAFTLPDALRKIVKGFPYSQQIDADGDAQAKDKMVVWADEVSTRIGTAVTTLRAQNDDFSKEEVDTY